MRSPNLLAIHLKAAGISSSPERSARLDRLLRSAAAAAEEKIIMNKNETSYLYSQQQASSHHVRWAEEASRALRGFSCGAFPCPASPEAQKVLNLHRAAMAMEETAEESEDEKKMQVDTPTSSGHGGAASAIKIAFKVMKADGHSYFLCIQIFCVSSSCAKVLYCGAQRSSA